MLKLFIPPAARTFSTALMLSLLGSATLAAQTSPSVQGTSLADTAGPAIIVPAQYGSDFFVLNKDLTQLRRNASVTSYYVNCAAPTGLTASSTTQRTYLTDDSSTYTTAQSSSATGIAANGTNFGSSTCTNGTPLALSGNAPAQSLASNDPRHGRYFVLSAFNGSSPDLITVFNNLNTNSSSTPSLTQKARTSLDTGAQYTSMVTDVASNYGLTAITELKTSSSPGNLWVYSPGINTAFKVLGPGGVALPAIGSFIIPPLNDGGGSLLVLINQDGLTSSNLSSPPQDTTPFTIIDLGQLQRSFSAVAASGNSITLPFVTQIKATTSFYAMLGAAYNPVNHLLYAVVGGGTSGTAVAKSVLSYDPRSPAAPAETLVADVSMVPFTFGAHPQVALNAASGTLQILTSSPTGLYSVGISGTGNTAVAVGGTPFADSNFTPSYLAVNPLAGETYIASASQIDILTKPSGAQNRATIDLTGPDTALANQNYSLYARSLYPAGDAALIAAPVTITATPATGSPFTFSSSTVGNFAGTYGLVSGTFPSPGVYTLVATVPATTNYPAFTSLPISVTVGATTNPGVYATTVVLAVPSTSSSTTVNGSVTLTGSTYAPTGRIVVTDATGNEVSRITLAGAPITLPMTVALILPQGASTLKAVYNGDDQNAGSTSATASITVGPSSATTPTLTQLTPPTGTAGATLSGNVTFASTTTVAPTDVISIYAVLSGTTTPITLTTIPASQAFVSGGKAFNFIAPAAGTYTVLAYYPGDTGYNTATSATSQLTISSNKISTTTSVSAVATTLRSTPFTATIRFTTASTGTVAPTGNITLTITNTLGSDMSTVSLTSAQAVGGFQKQLQYNYTGQINITATYAGDANYASSTGTVTVDLTQYNGTLTLTAPPTITAGLPATVNVKFVPATTTQPPPTDTVFIQLQDVNGTQLINATVSPADYLSPTGANITFTPTLIGTQSSSNPGGTPSGRPGLGTVSANLTNYSTPYGDVSSSVRTTIVLNKPTLALTGPATGTLGTSYTATLKLGNAPSTTTGTVNIAVTGTGQAFNVTASVSDALAGAGIPVAFSLAGAYTLTATYSGDGNNDTASASPITTTISTPSGTTPTFVLTAADPSVSDRAGAVPFVLLGVGYVDVNLNLTGYNGYATPVTLSFAKVSGDNSLVGNFSDDNTKTIVTSATPTANGTPITLHASYFVYNLPHVRPAGMAGGLGLGALALFLLCAGSGRKESPRMKIRSLPMLLLPLLLLGTLPLISGCGEAYNYGQYLVTATPAPSAADQTKRTAVVWIKTQISLYE